MILDPHLGGKSLTRKEVEALAGEFDEQLIKFIKGLKKSVKEQLDNSEGDQNLELLMEYYGFLAHLSQEVDMQNAPEWTKLIYSKIMGDLYAIYTLLQHGSNYQAMEVLRSLTDTAISAKYISLDPINRGQLFVQHRYLEDYFLASDADKSIYQANYLLYKNNYMVNEAQGYSQGWYQKEMKNFIGGDERYRGKNPSIKLMAQIGDLSELYDSVYSLGSGFTHGSSHLATFLNNIPKYDQKKAQFISGITIKLIAVVVESLMETANNTIHPYDDLHAALVSKLSDAWEEMYNM